MKTANKVLVTRRALIQRLNRVLAKDDLMVKKTRGTQAQMSIGDYFVLNVTGNYVAEKDVDLEKLGRKHGVLAAWEKLC